MGSFDGSKDTEFLECCNVCGGFFLKKEYYTQIEDNTILCKDCRTQYRSKPITKKTIKLNNVGELTNTPIIYQSPNTRSFYEQKSIEQFGTTDHWRELFYKEELYKLPTFNYQKHQHMLDEQAERDKKVAERKANPVPPYAPPKPKCPTCGSTNIQKISTAKRAVYGAAFGLFSTTAKSQFHCNNCGKNF